jgi:sec-independent protein translocase protein TatA
MFDIGGGEIVLILMVVLMLFGSDKIPDIARTLGKLMAQLKNATNDIKHEIQKGVDTIESEVNLKEITHEITKAKDGIANNSLEAVNKIKDDFEEIAGSVKRQL